MMPWDLVRRMQKCGDGDNNEEKDQAQKKYMSWLLDPSISPVSHRNFPG